MLTSQPAVAKALRHGAFTRATCHPVRSSRANAASYRSWYVASARGSVGVAWSTARRWRASSTMGVAVGAYATCSYVARATAGFA